MTLYLLDEDESEVLASVCEHIVPGSAAVGPVVYVDAVASDWPPERQAELRSALAAMAPVLEGGAGFLAEHQDEPEFQLLRVLAVEAYYSDFAQPGYDGPTAWDEVDFNSDQARRLDKDWSFIRCFA